MPGKKGKKTNAADRYSLLTDVARNTQSVVPDQIVPDIQLDISNLNDPETEISGPTTLVLKRTVSMNSLEKKCSAKSKAIPDYCIKSEQLMQEEKKLHQEFERRNQLKSYKPDGKGHQQIEFEFDREEKMTTEESIRFSCDEILAYDPMIQQQSLFEIQPDQISQEDTLENFGERDIDLEQMELRARKSLQISNNNLNNRFIDKYPNVNELAAATDQESVHQDNPYIPNSYQLLFQIHQPNRNEIIFESSKEWTLNQTPELRDKNLTFTRSKADHIMESLNSEEKILLSKQKYKLGCHKRLFGD